MAKVTGYTAERMKEIEDNTIVDADIAGGHLILTRFNGTQFDAGQVQGEQGVQGPQGPPGVTPVNPPGVIFAYAGMVAPAGYLLCEGQAVSRATYADLFAAIGVEYGPGDGNTTFNVPDMRGRVPVGLDVAQTEFMDLNNFGGEKAVYLDDSELPYHEHSFHGTSVNNGSSQQLSFLAVENDSAAVIETGTPLQANTPSNLLGGVGANTSSEGIVGRAHQNMPPYRVVNWIIKV